jgi:hypothetical protein
VFTDLGLPPVPESGNVALFLSLALSCVVTIRRRRNQRNESVSY